MNGLFEVKENDVRTLITFYRSITPQFSSSTGFIIGKFVEGPKDPLHILNIIFFVNLKENWVINLICFVEMIGIEEIFYSDSN